MKKKLLVALLSVSSMGFAGQCEVHTWHDVRSQRGEWEVSLQLISQMEHGALVDSNCQEIHSQGISLTQSLKYGLSFDNQADFNIAYTLTAVEQSTGFDKKACVFVITANKPADPDVRVSSFHGADCGWNVIPGVGENFLVG